MTMRVGWIAWTPFLFFGGGVAVAQDKEAISQETFDRLVEELGNEDFETRERAQRELESFGKGILPLLKDAHAMAKDLERRTRLGELIRKIESPPPPNPVERNRFPEQEFGGGVFRIERPDPKKVLEEMLILVEQMKKVLENKDLSDEEKLREATRLASQLQSAALRGTSANVIRIQRIVRSGQEPGGGEKFPGGNSKPAPAPAPAPAPEERSKPKEY